MGWSWSTVLPSFLGDRNPCSLPPGAESFVMLGRQKTPPGQQSVEPVGDLGRSRDQTCLKVISAVALVLSVAFFAVTLAYSFGAFHFEAFIGPIGASIFPTVAGTFVVLASVMLVNTYCNG